VIPWGSSNSAVIAIGRIGRRFLFAGNQGTVFAGVSLGYIETRRSVAMIEPGMETHWATSGNAGEVARLNAAPLDNPRQRAADRGGVDRFA